MDWYANAKLTTPNRIPRSLKPKLEKCNIEELFYCEVILSDSLDAVRIRSTIAKIQFDHQQGGSRIGVEFDCLP